MFYLSGNKDKEGRLGVVDTKDYDLTKLSNKKRLSLCERGIAQYDEI